ncbi:MAG: redoxin family protein [Puniceicoccales bacterium]|jgi:nucleoredoxin|nr:redoxin family protein [Puniceicoccales bacterium]
MKKLLFLLSALIIAAIPLQADEPSKDTKTSYHKEVLDSAEKFVIKPKGGKGDVEPLRKKKYLFIYFSASWCGPCKVFTPKLVDFYKKNERNRDFDVLFISLDSDQKAMTAYMKSEKMPWMGVKHGSKGANEIKTKYAGAGVPHLVLLNEKDEVIAVGQANVMNAYEAARKKRK